MATPNEGPEGPEVHDVNSASEKLHGLLDPESLETRQGEGAAGENDPDGEDVEAIEGLLDAGDEPEDDEPEDEPEAEDDDPDEEPDGEDDGDEAEEEDPKSDTPQTYTVKVDGEEFEVTLDEALAGYQRQEAFSRKTQAVSEERKAVQAERAEVQQARETYQQVLQQAHAFVKAQMPEKPSDDLRQRNPRQYAEQLTAYNDRVEQLQQIQAEYQRSVADQQKQEHATRQERLAEEREKLVSAIPDWVDEDKANEEQQRMVQYAETTYGYAPEELQAVVDHRPLVLLRKAMLYDEMMEKGDRVKRTKKKRDPAPTLKPGTRDTSSKSDKASKKRQKAARNRLRKSGSADDAAAVLHDILE